MVVGRLCTSFVPYCLGVSASCELSPERRERRDSTPSVLEVQMSNKVKDMDKFKVLLYDIRSDVSFIRGEDGE